MARSQEGRARQRARRDQYADGVLVRIAKKTNGDARLMPWGNDLAALLPNHLSQKQRDDIIAMREESPIEALKMIVKAASMHAHVSGAGKVIMPKAGLTGPDKWRADVTIKPSWDKADNGPAVVHTCTEDESTTWHCPACTLDRKVIARTRAHHN